jgi:DnaK suppressor protein
MVISTDTSAASLQCEVRAALHARHAELSVEYDGVVGGIAGPEHGLLVADSGDDVADIGTKTFNREQEFALANAIRSRLDQVERALARLDEGGYGWCERCGEAISPARLTAFPSVTLCVRCKQFQERH